MLIDSRVLRTQGHLYLEIHYLTKLCGHPEVLHKPSELELRWMVIRDLFNKFNAKFAEGKNVG